MSIAKDMKARILQCTDVEYLNDPCERPSLSKSVANEITRHCPRKGWAIHPRLGGIKRKPNDVLTDGVVLHKLLLGKGAEIDVIDADSFRTNYAKERRDEAWAADKVPVLLDKFEEYKLAAASIAAECKELGYVFDGQSEVAVEWSEQGVNGPVVCRCKFDHVYMQEAVIIDLKKSRSASPDDVSRNSFGEYGMDINFVAYRRAFTALTGIKEPTFKFLVCELEPPYIVTAIEPDAYWEQIGEARWRQALVTWEECLARGSGREHWPAYANDTVCITPPLWERRKWLGDERDVSDLGLVA